MLSLCISVIIGWNIAWTIMRKRSDSRVNRHSWQVVQYRSGHSHCSETLAVGVFVPLPRETVFSTDEPQIVGDELRN